MRNRPAHSFAEFSECRTWRYSLTRLWDEDKPRIAFVGLNPSTADETQDDPTIRRCVRYANDWGYGSMIMLNVYAFRATDPREMKKAPDPFGPENSAFLGSLSILGGTVVIAWGNNAAHMSGGRRALWDLRRSELFCLGKTKRGEPKHPLYLRADLKPQPWEA